MCDFVRSHRVARRRGFISPSLSLHITPVLRQYSRICYGYVHKASPQSFEKLAKQMLPRMVLPKVVKVVWHSGPPLELITSRIICEYMMPLLVQGQMLNATLATTDPICHPSNITKGSLCFRKCKRRSFLPFVGHRFLVIKWHR